MKVEKLESVEFFVKLMTLAYFEFWTNFQINYVDFWVLLIQEI